MGPGEFADDFRGEGFADLAGGIVDATLRQGERAAAIAGFGVEAVQRNFLLLRRELREVHAGKLAGTVGVLQEYFSRVLESFHFDARRQAEKRADFYFVKRGIAQANVLLEHAALRVENKGSGKRRDPTVLDAKLHRSDADRVVDAEILDELMDGVHVVIIHDQANDLEAVFVTFLQFDEVGNFGAARPAPGSPEVEQYDFPARSGERNRFAIQAGKLKFRRGIGIADEIDRGLRLPLLLLTRVIRLG